MGQRESQYVSVSDFADGMDAVGSSGAMVYIANIIYGLALLAVAAVGALYFLKKFMNLPYYDKFIASKLNYRPTFMMGVLGAGGSILQMFLYLFASAKRGAFGFSVKMSAGVNWTTWLLLVIFAGVLAYDMLVLAEKKPVAAPAEEQTETFVESNPFYKS